MSHSPTLTSSPEALQSQPVLGAAAHIHCALHYIYEEQFSLEPFLFNNTTQTRPAGVGEMVLPFPRSFSPPEVDVKLLLRRLLTLTLLPSPRTTCCPKLWGGSVLCWLPHCEMLLGAAGGEDL